MLRAEVAFNIHLPVKLSFLCSHPPFRVKGLDSWRLRRAKPNECIQSLPMSLPNLLNIREHRCSSAHTICTTGILTLRRQIPRG